MGMVSEFSNAANAASYASAVQSENTAQETSSSKRAAANVTGRTIGTPRLSDKAAKYYEQLQKKYSNMDFILVSEDQKEQAKSQASSYANAGRMVVLIDEDKIERMAEDENYRAKYEQIIASSASGISQLKSSLSASGANVKGFGMQINDNGTASYFAVLEKSSADQKERIEKKAAEKKEAKKAADKKAEAKKAADKKAEAKKAEKKRSDKLEEEDDDGDSDTITITASSIEDLIKKIGDYTQMSMSDNVLTESEQKVGQHIDFKG